MKMGTTKTFEMPTGWTLRQVATVLAREWLTPLRTAVPPKSARWIVQPSVEEPANSQPLWEEGIATAEYERRLERLDLAWSVKAKTGRLRGTSLTLARLTIHPDRPLTFDMVCSQDALPDTLCDPDKLAAFREAHGFAGAEGLFAALLIDHGFRVASSH